MEKPKKLGLRSLQSLLLLGACWLIVFLFSNAAIATVVTVLFLLAGIFGALFT